MALQVPVPHRQRVIAVARRVLAELHAYRCEHRRVCVDMCTSTGYRHCRPAEEATRPVRSDSLPVAPLFGRSFLRLDSFFRRSSKSGLPPRRRRQRGSIERSIERSIECSIESGYRPRRRRQRRSTWCGTSAARARARRASRCPRCRCTAAPSHAPAGPTPRPSCPDAARGTRSAPESQHCLRANTA